MPTISAKIVRNPWTPMFCDGRCGKRLPLYKPRMRLYGMAHRGDPPYVVHICLSCASESDDPKIIDALSAFNKSLVPTANAAAQL